MPRKKASRLALERRTSLQSLAPDASTRNGHLRSVLSVVLEINRLCCRQIPPFTMSENRMRERDPNPTPFCIPNFAYFSVDARTGRSGGLLSSEFRLVEPIGIEPTTSSLQSSRSPN